MDIPRLSLESTPLRERGLSTYSGVSAMTEPHTVSARARQRLRDELHAKNISQQDLADMLTARDTEAWSQPRVGKVLTGKVHLRLEDVAMIAKCLGLAVTEVIRDRGLEFYAEMTPTELRILERIRQRPHILNALLVLLDITPTPKDESPKLPRRRKVGRPRNSERDRAENSVPAQSLPHR